MSDETLWEHDASLAVNKVLSNVGKFDIMSKNDPAEFMAKSRQAKFSELRKKSGLSIKDIARVSGYNERTIYRWENGEIRPRQLVLDYLNNKFSEKIWPSTNGCTFTFIDLFAGIGGMRIAFERVGGKCVYTCERDSRCLETYEKNFPCNHKVDADIRDVDIAEIPRHDMLLAGFPCQPFSIAGVSKKNSLGRPHGFKCKTQGTLFHDLAKIIERHRPRAFLLENVKNLLNHDKGKTFEVIRETLEDELGYTISYRVIDAKCFVPQHRERVFIAGFREKVSFTFDDLILPPSSTGPRLGAILHPEDGSEPCEEPYTYGPKALVNPKYTLTEKLWTYLQNYAAKHKAKGNGFGFGLFGKHDVARTLSARYYKDGSEILLTQRGKRPRRLTPRECARLMGFDRPGFPKFKIPVSDTQAYRQFGNAVVVQVVEAVARHMMPYLSRKPVKMSGVSGITWQRENVFAGV